MTNLKPLKILIATPAYDGKVATKFLLSLLNSIEIARREGLKMAFYTIDSDSLITRARNNCAKFAMDGKFDRLMFIDADIVFEYEQIKRLLHSDKRVIGGTYPIKNFPLKLNFNALPDQANDFASDRTVEAYKKFCEKYADKETGEVEVRHVPTGFLMIDVSVFRELQGRVKTYSAFDAGTMRVQSYDDFFPVQITDGIYETEDWGFCTQCRANGIPVYMQTKVVVKHLGKHLFNADEA